MLRKLDEDPAAIARSRHLSVRAEAAAPFASRGVIRADNAQSFRRRRTAD